MDSHSRSRPPHMGKTGSTLSQLGEFPKPMWLNNGVFVCVSIYTYWGILSPSHRGEEDSGKELEWIKLILNHAQWSQSRQVRFCACCVINVTSNLALKLIISKNDTHSTGKQSCQDNFNLQDPKRVTVSCLRSLYTVTASSFLFIIAHSHYLHCSSVSRKVGWRPKNLHCL